MSSQPSAIFLSEEENRASFILEMPDADRQMFLMFDHFKIDPGYLGREYVVYTLNSSVPVVQAIIKIVGWYAGAERGSVVVLEDMITGETLEVSHVPTRLFRYDVFFAIPPYQRIRWETRKSDGKRSLSFTVGLKMEDRPETMRDDLVYIEATSEIKKRFPRINLRPVAY